MKSKKKLTIITVCYNCENLVKITLDSLVNQTYQDFEYIVIDGNSSDNTINIIKENSKRLENVIIKSESDNGIYDAMNKGIKLATGEFIYFLNIGDEFYNDSVLENVVTNLKNYSVYYGNIALNKEKIVNYPNKITSLYLARKMICHQAIFAPTKLLKSNLFDTKYKYCADQDWLINTIKNKKVIHEHLPIVICHYDETGVSSVNAEKVYKESMIVREKYFSKTFIKLANIRKIVVKFIKKILLSCN